MTNFEPIVGLVIFVVGLYAVIRDWRFFIYILLFFSVFLHKELFSLYKWDLMPIRFLMAAVSVFVSFTAIRKLLWLFKRRKLLTGDVLAQKAAVLELLHDPFIVFLSLLWLVRLISLLFSADTTSSITLFAFFTTIYFGGLFVYVKLKKSTTDSLRFINFYIFIGLLLCLFGFVQLFVHYSYGLTIGSLWAIPKHLPRVGSIFWDVNHFGGFIASLLPLCAVQALTSHTLKAKAYNLFCILSFTVILFLTNSRTSWMLMAISVVVFLFLLVYKKLKVKGILLGLVIALFVAGFFVYSYSIKDSEFRLVVKNYFHYRLDSFDSHFLLLRGASQVFEKHPIFGGGYGSFFEQFKKTEVSSLYLSRDPAGLITKVPAHTIWGEVAAETGILGLGVFILLFILLVSVPLYNFLVSSYHKDYLIHGAIVASIVGWFTAGIFYSYNSEFFWFVLILYLAYSASTYFKLENKPLDLQAFKRMISYIEQKFNAGFIFLALISFTLIFINLGKHTFITWDEAIYAKIAKNMVESGDYLRLRWLMDKTWFEKPPLYFWTTALFMKIFGITELAARLTSAIAGFGTVLVTTYFAKRAFGKSVAYLSGLILLTTFQFLYYSRAAMLDVTVTFFMVCALTIYFLRARNTTTLLLSGVFVGLAAMTKGVVGFLPLLIIFMFEVSHAYFDEIGFKKALKNSVINSSIIFLFSLIIFLPWHLYMFSIYGPRFIDNYFIYHVLQRATESIEDKGRPFFWYLIVLKVSMRIWFILLIPTFIFSSLLVCVRRIPERLGLFLSKQEKLGIVYLLIWASVTFLFFSLPVSKLIWYIIPIYPVLAIICAVGFIFSVKSIYKILPVGVFKDITYISAFALVLIGLTYFYIERKKVYTDNLTFPQVSVILKSNGRFPNDTVRIDKVDYPLMYYYRKGPYTPTRFKEIKAQMALLPPGSRLVFITSERRYQELSALYPLIELYWREDDFVLASITNL